MTSGTQSLYLWMVAPPWTGKCPAGLSPGVSVQQSPARSLGTGFRFRETGTQGQGKNRGEERESAEQWEQGDMGWGAGTGGQGSPFPRRWDPQGHSPLC